MLNLRNVFCARSDVGDAHEQAVDGGRAERRAGGERRDAGRLEDAVHDVLAERVREQERGVGGVVLLVAQRQERGAAGARPQPALDALLARHDLGRREAAQDREAALVRQRAGGAGLGGRDRDRAERHDRAARAASPPWCSSMPAGLILRKSTAAAALPALAAGLELEQVLVPRRDRRRGLGGGGLRRRCAGRVGHLLSLHRQRGREALSPVRDGDASAAAITLLRALWRALVEQHDGARGLVAHAHALDHLGGRVLRRSRATARRRGSSPPARPRGRRRRPPRARSTRAPAAPARPRPARPARWAGCAAGRRTGARRAGGRPPRRRRRARRRGGRAAAAAASASASGLGT